MDVRKWCIPEMEAAIQFNQMDLHEVRPEQGLPSLCQERHIWRMPELPPITLGLNHFQVASIEIYQSQYKNWFREAKEEEWEISQAFGRGHELLLTHQEIYGSGEDNRTLRRVEHIILQRQGQKDKELVEEPQSFIYRPKEGIGNDFSFGRRPSGIYPLQKHPKRSPKDPLRRRKVPRTIKAKEKRIGTDLTHKATGSQNWSLQPWTVSTI
ncbi:hypothetical protein O181_060479 [Austropuccinia psidii MF-1]|uniref:Uncharacterized protein n=1 Tax=Austropuccinia psidii MF-1 TaxID=1389203 RepID=A0A9Q3HZN7_9BASI|nr:hypothetical protein [Austropuccinia psidii MF-1]